MSKKKIDESVFLEAIRTLIHPEDKVIVLYSGIWSFANNLDFKNKNIIKTRTHKINEKNEKINKKI